MAQQKLSSLDHIHFENVSFQIEGLDPVLKSVDLEFPMDQTVIIHSSNPAHAVQVLEMLAGRKEPVSGRITWRDDKQFGEGLQEVALREVMGCFFESIRPDPNLRVSELLIGSGAPVEMIKEALEHFEIQNVRHKKFKLLPFQLQKLILMIIPTLKTPQMLVLEDPAVGLPEDLFLNYLDWIQMWQRQGHLRHIFMTNNHPTAARHFESFEMYIEDGLIYLEDTDTHKKIVHF